MNKINLTTALVLSYALMLAPNTLALEASLVRPAELSYSTDGKPYARLTLGGTQGDGKRFYHNLTVLGERSEKLAALEPGSALLIGARLEYSTWVDDAGQEQSRNKLTLSSYREPLGSPRLDAVLSDTTGETSLVLQGGSSQLTLEGIVVGNRGLKFQDGVSPRPYTLLSVVYPNPAYYPGGSAPELGQVEVLVMDAEAEKVAELGVGWGIALEGRVYLSGKAGAPSRPLAVFAERTFAFSLTSPDRIGGELSNPSVQGEADLELPDMLEALDAYV